MPDKKNTKKTDVSNVQKKMEVVSDRTKSVEERKRAYNDAMGEILNPVPKKDFNPDTFDPKSDTPNFDVKKRPRVDIPEELETYGLKPKALLKGQMIGMYESKQDLYLLIAHVNNLLKKRIDALEERVKNVENSNRNS